MSNQQESGAVVAGHTPGPWTADIGETAVIRDKHGNQLAIFTHIHTRTGGRRAADEVARNTRIAAAAPELLEALQNIISGLSLGDEEGLVEYAPQMIAARAAITKATGATS